jgi:hypothetical protein
MNKAIKIQGDLVARIDAQKEKFSLDTRQNLANTVMRKGLDFLEKFGYEELLKIPPGKPHVSLDYDKGNPVTVSGYASRWGWSRKKVKRFLERVGAEISYPENTARKQNQKGQIRVQIRNRSGTDRVADKEQIRIIDSKWLADKRNRSGTDRVADKEQIRDRSGSATINPKSLILDPKSENGPPNPPSEPFQNEPGRENGDRPKNTSVQDAFLDCKKYLGMSEQEIIDVYSTCRDKDKFSEAVRFAIEKNQERLLDNPSGFIMWACKNGKTSKKTRQAVADKNMDDDISEQVRMTIEQCEEAERNQRLNAPRVENNPSTYIDPCPENEIPF